MGNYYFLSSFLPTLTIGHVPALDFSELKELLKINLSAEDLRKTRAFCEMIDVENMRALWAGEPIDPRGNYTSAELHEALLDLKWPGDVDFPLYMKDFLEKYTSSEERLKHFPLLMTQFLEDGELREEGFLSHYFQFERQWRLVMVGFRAKKTHRNLDWELQYEDPTDPLVAEILAQKDAKTYEPPFEYKELKPIFGAFEDSPLELAKALYEYRFTQIQDLYNGEFFSIDRILGYMARLLIVERWLELDMQKGIGVIDRVETKISENT